jgi:hypothetical protein
VPVGQPRARVHAARLGVLRLARLGAHGTGLGGRLIGLSLEGLREQLGAEGAADLDGEFFEGVEGGAPRGAVGSVQVVEQVFGRGGQHGTQFGGDVYLGGVWCHREILSAVTVRTRCGLAQVTLGIDDTPCKQCRTPG